METIVCITHLRWGFVWQRPQHLLGRLAGHYRVIFIEEPVTTREAQPRLEVFPAANAANVTVVRMLFPATHDFWIGHGDPRTQASYEKLVTAWLATQGVVKPLLWLYTPMAHHFLDAIPHSLFIFDAMDQLSAFAGAPPELIDNERRVLRRADLVFAGGLSLYREKRPYNDNSHCLPSGVDIEHFAKAADRRNFAKPPELASLKAPILGYFGVIDERIDLDLIAALAKAHPDWQIVMIGPVVKIDMVKLPKAQNIHYPGGRDYVQLPAYLAWFDVALLPFALNEATRYISPTKTLEYMAARKPIVSTAIRDVIDSYGEVVHVANSTAEFIQMIEEALRGTGNPNRRRKENEYLAANTWESITERMQVLIEERRQQVNPDAQPSRDPLRN